MDYKTNKFSLSQAEQNLRIGLVELIRDHVERGLTKEELIKVLDSLEHVLHDYRFKDVRDLEDEAIDIELNTKRFFDE